ncbi:MAG: RsmE family RNA methyltransferase [Chitinophagaceae bacterium]
MADLPLFFHPKIAQAQESLELPEESARHIVQVLRMQVGEALQLVDGRGILADCIIQERGKKSCKVSIEKRTFQTPYSPSLQLCIAFTKNASRNEWLLEKATELGVGLITPIITERSIRERIKEDRWHKILVSAMLQSRQTWLPILEGPQTFESIISSNSEQKLLAHCMDGDAEKLPISEALKLGFRTQIFIGPEGDFSPTELILAKQAKAVSISLGSNRLRTETAALAAIIYFYLINHAY